MTKKSDKELVTRGMLNEAVEAILVGMDNLAKLLRLEFKNLLKEELEPIRADIGFIKHDIRDIKADLSLTASKKEFNELKAKVETLSP